MEDRLDQHALFFVADLIPFIWAHDPALLTAGAPLATGVVVATTLGAILLVSRNMSFKPQSGARWLAYAACWLAAGAIAGSPIMLGAQPIFAARLAGAGLIWWLAVALGRNPARRGTGSNVAGSA